MRTNRNVSLITPQYSINTPNNYLNELSNSIRSIATNLEKNIAQSYSAKVDSSIRDEMHSIYLNNSDNPDQLQKEIESYSKSFAKNIPFDLRDSFNQTVSTLGQQYVSKSLEDKSRQISVEQRIALENNEDSITRDILDAARSLFSNQKGLTEDQIKARQISAMNVVAHSSNDLISKLQAIGADGKPLLTPDQIVTKQNKLYQALFSESANAFFQSSPNKFKAMMDWREGRVSIHLPEGKINVRDLMPADVREKVDAKILADYREYESIRKMNRVSTNDQADSFADTQIVANAYLGNSILDPFDKKNVKAVNNSWLAIKSEIQNKGGGLKDTIEAAVDFSARVGILPQDIKSTLNAAIFNGTPEQREFYSDFVVNINKINPILLSGIKRDVVSTAFEINRNITAGIPRDQAIERAMMNIDKGKTEDIKTRTKRWSSDKSAIEVSMNNFLENMDESYFSTAKIPDKMKDEFSFFQKESFLKDGVDMESAAKVAEATIKKTWGVTDVGGTGKRYMKYPPERFYSVNGDSRWIKKQLREKTAFIPEDKVSLTVVPDSVSSGKPSYYVMKEDEYGVINHALDAYNQFITFTPDYTKTDEYRKSQVVSKKQGVDIKDIMNRFYRNRSISKNKSDVRTLLPLGR